MNTRRVFEIALFFACALSLLWLFGEFPSIANVLVLGFFMAVSLLASVSWLKSPFFASASCVFSSSLMLLCAFSPPLRQMAFAFSDGFNWYLAAISCVSLTVLLQVSAKLPRAKA